MEGVVTIATINIVLVIVSPEVDRVITSFSMEDRMVPGVACFNLVLTITCTDCLLARVLSESNTVACFDPVCITPEVFIRVFGAILVVSVYEMFVVCSVGLLGRNSIAVSSSYDT